MNEDYTPYTEEVIPNRVLSQAQKVKEEMDKAAARFQKRNRVGTGTIILMIMVAGFYDLLQFLFSFIIIDLGFLSICVTIYSWLTFYVWTSIKGWDFGDTSMKKLIARYGFPIIEIIPWVNSIPGITLGTILTILIMKSDDFIYNTTKGRTDEKVIKEGMQFFNLFRNVYNV